MGITPGLALGDVIKERLASQMMSDLIKASTGVTLPAEDIEKLVATKWETLATLAHLVHRRVG